MAVVAQGAGGTGVLPGAFDPQNPVQTVTPKGPAAAITSGAAGQTPWDPGSQVMQKAAGDSTGAGQPTPQAPATAPDQITLNPGYTPDASQAIANNPGVASQVATNNTNNANAATARQAQVRAAVIAYGGLPPGFQDTYGDVDQATQDAASGNQYSTLAGLKRNYDTSVEQFRRALAARGALQSGDLGYGQDQIDTGYGQNLYDAGNTEGNTLGGAVSNYVGVLGQSGQNYDTAVGTATGQEEQNPANQPVAPTTAAHDPALTSTYGVDIYKGADGTLYTRDGSVFDPTNPRQTTAAGAVTSGGYAPYGYGIGQTL